MANPLKGAVSFKIGEESHSLAFSAEALYRLEKVVGMNMAALEKIIFNAENVTMDLVRTMFWAGLLDEKPDLDLDEVGQLFSRVQPLEAVKLVTRAFTGAFTDPDAAAPDVPLKPGQKPNKKGGTGSAS